MSEQELRDRLRASVAGVDLRPGLAERVERAHLRRRVGQISAAALAVAVGIGVVVAVVPDRSPAPAAAAPPGCAELPVPPPAALNRGTTSGWAWRGNPSQRPEATRLARSFVGQEYGGGAVTAAEPVLLVPQVLDGTTRQDTYAVAVRNAHGWQLAVGQATSRAGDIGTVSTTLVPLPAPAPGVTVSAYTSIRLNGQLERTEVLVLAAPGTGRIEYVGCRDGATTRSGTEDPYLLAPATDVEEAGQVLVTVGGRVVSADRVQDITELSLPAAAAVAEPSGYAVVMTGTARLLAGDRTQSVEFRRPQGLPLALDRALVLGTCRGRGAVRVDGVELACDGRTHPLRDGPLDLATWEARVTGEPDPATGRTSLAVNLVVAEPR